MHEQDRVRKLEQDFNEILGGLRNDMNDMKGKLDENREYATTNYRELRVEVNDNLADANTKHHELSQSYQELKKSVDGSVRTGGATYVRWGRKTCPGNGSELVYSGYAGGSRYDHKGAAASMLCLPTNPDWAMYKVTLESSGGYMYGAEYESSMGRTDQFFGSGRVNHDVPCAVCIVQRRSSHIMIPGKTKCHAGWTFEYSGYLMTGYYNFPAAREYHCVDKAAETLYGGERNDDGYLLYFVEARCGSVCQRPRTHVCSMHKITCSAPRYIQWIGVVEMIV